MSLMKDMVTWITLEFVCALDKIIEKLKLKFCNIFYYKIECNYDSSSDGGLFSQLRIIHNICDDHGLTLKYIDTSTYFEPHPNPNFYYTRKLYLFFKYKDDAIKFKLLK